MEDVYQELNAVDTEAKLMSHVKGLNHIFLLLQDDIFIHARRHMIYVFTRI